LTVNGDVVEFLDGGNQPLINLVSINDDAFNGLDPVTADNTAQDVDQIPEIAAAKRLISATPSGV